MEAVRGPARIVRRLEFYKTFYGPVVRLALSVYPMEGEPLRRHRPQRLPGQR